MRETAYDFTGSVAIVTGANGNLGSAVARAFASTGATLALVGRKRERVVAALGDLVEDHTVWVAPSTDLTAEPAVLAMVEQARERFGKLDVVANTVGGYRGGTPIRDVESGAWDFMLSLNARSAFLLSKAVVPIMVAQGHGALIHTASRAAEQGARKAAAYAAGKAAVLGLVDSLALELKSQNINVNCVLPGTIDTPTNRAAMPSADTSRWVTPASVARAFLFLASEDARDLHGVHLPVYGRS